MPAAWRVLAAPSLRVLRVSGDSLWPEFQNGDFVLTLKIPILYDSWRPGDVVAFRHPLYGLLIKKVDHRRLEDGRLFVTGNVAHSLDSREFGAISPDTVIGKVIGHIRQSLPRPRP